jgi:starch phosphorylase
MQIIYLINHYHLKEASAGGFTNADEVSALSLVGEGDVKRVRMGHLAFVGSQHVNGVSALHTELMQHTTFRMLNAALPGRIVNKTNGISVRRWLFEANPQLTTLITDTIGKSFLDNVDAIARLEEFATDATFVRKIIDVRRENKDRLTHLVSELTGIQIDPGTLFDVHIKRIHEYKRQLLNILEAVALYQSILAHPHADWAPRTKIFAGKAAPDYAKAKLIIKLAHDVGQVINADPAMARRLKVVFIPNYSVSLAEAIIPAADLSEQISTAGMEASGTGNMKLALNGALTIGTLDGANVEIRQRVGADNFFAFGLSAEEVDNQRRARITGASVATPVLQKALASIAAGHFSLDDPTRYRGIVDGVLGYDHFMVAADFDAYWRAQRSIDALWHQPAAWWRTSILNTARVSWFSSDRTIREYAREIWGISR